jgi:hypothetical protein
MEVEEVQKFFSSLSAEACQIIANLCNGDLEIDPLDIPEQFKGTAKWVAQCHNFPSRQELTMSALNDVIEGFGTEPIRPPNDSNTLLATYVNTGDTYSGTVVYDHEKEEYVLTTWGDWYSGWIDEQNAENGTIQCGWCSYLTPQIEPDGYGDTSNWRDTICENCGNYVDGREGP